MFQRGRTAGIPQRKLLSSRFFIYIHRPQRQSAHTTSLRRATAARVKQAATAVEDSSAANPNVLLGEIMANHVAMSHAKQPPGTEFKMPNDNTTQQAQQLDAARQELADLDEEAGRNRRSIRITLTVDTHSLSAALGLPQHDLFHEGIYNGYQHPTMAAGDDVPDVDHMDEEDEAPNT